MHDYAAEAIELLGNKSIEEVEADRLLQLALERLALFVAVCHHMAFPTPEATDGDRCTDTQEDSQGS